MIIENFDDYELCSIDSIEHIVNEEVVYDITVDGDHSFFVRNILSDKYILSHNCDGMHINGLLINMLHHFWPELFTLGIVHRFITPLVKAYVGKEVINFYTEDEYLAWAKKTNKKHTSKYFKGLGTSKTSDFKEYLADMKKHLIKYEIEDQADTDAINLAFSKTTGKSNNRKDWLDLL